MADDSRLAPWQTIDKSLALETPWFKIHKQRMRMPSGVELDYFVHDASDSVICVCINDQKQVLVVERQYRPPVEKVSVDHPAGKIDDTDKSPRAAMLRELKEEVGLVPTSLKQIGVVDKDPGFSNSRMYVFLATGDMPGKAQQEATESIVSAFVSPAKIIAMINSGEMACTFCVSATFLAFKELGLLTLNVDLL